MIGSDLVHSAVGPIGGHTGGLNIGRSTSTHRKQAPKAMAITETQC
jgi:hypothetical protein